MKKEFHPFVTNFFTRTQFCRECYNNNLPINDKNYLNKKNTVQFAIVKSRQSLKIDIRKQTRIGVRGYTPHLFQIIGKNLVNKTYYLVLTCAMHNCGVSITMDKQGYRKIRQNYTKEIILDEKLLENLYQDDYKKFLLDYKEKNQFFFSVREFGELSGY